MNNKVRFISINTKLIAIFLCGTIIPLFIMTFSSYHTSQNLLERKYSDLLLDIASQSTIRIGEFLREVEKLSLVASYGMNSYVSASSSEAYPIQDFLRDSGELNESIVYRMLMNYILLKDRLFSIYIYNLNGGKDMFISSHHPIDYNYRPVEEKWFNDFLASKQKVSIVSTGEDLQTRTENHKAIQQARKIFDIHNGKLIGVMVISMDIDFINIVNNQLQEGLRSRFAIVNEDNQIIYHADASLIGQSFSDRFPSFAFKGERQAQEAGGVRNEDGDYIVAKSEFKNVPWTTYFYLPINEVSAEGDILKRNLMILASLMLIISIVIFFYSSSVITRPIRRLMRNMTLVEMGQFDHLPTIRSRDEIGLMSNRFKQMTMELKQLVERIHKEEKEKASVEIQALQSQINPHFLYNTLGSIKWIASMQQANKIVDMTDALISLLRYAARHEGSMVPLHEEMNNISNYITIQNVRYYNRIQLISEIEDGLMNHLVPKLILQPIIENAIFHGIADSEEDGTIMIHISRENGVLTIRIRDNGIGMEQETMSALEQSLSSQELQPYGIGVRNVHRRIQLHYGEQYGVTFTSAQGIGTTFTIMMPSQQYGRGMHDVKADHCG